MFPMRWPVMVLFLALPLASVASQSNDAESSVNRALADYREAWLAADEALIISKLSDDIQVFVPSETGGKLDGKQAVRQWWFPETDQSYPIIEYDISNQEIVVDGDLAIVTGLSRLKWQTVESGQVVDEQTSHSEYMTVMKKEDGAWKLFRQMYQMRGAPTQAD